MAPSRSQVDACWERHKTSPKAACAGKQSTESMAPKKGLD